MCFGPADRKSWYNRVPTADIDFIPRRPGRFELRCADHDWAGMMGEIIVQ